MALGSHFLDELRARITISEVIGRRVKVTRAGREYKACCPFHHEKTPSFTINDDKQFYHCFGCGAHGDVIKFLMEHDNLSFMDAVEMLAAEAGLQVPKQTPQERAQVKEEKDLHGLLEDVTCYFEACLLEPRHSDALNYLLDRGISRQTIKDFRIGFAPDDPQVLRKVMLEKGYSDKEMIKAAALRPGKGSGKDPYTFFRDRVMFPVPDRRGRIVAFGGRVLPEHLRPPQRSDFTPPKYMNSTETPLFHKGRMLYGEPTARRAAAEGRVLILVEGYMDVIACVQAGIGGALAPMGTAVTEEQIITMWKIIPDFNKVPILCFDGDNAGRKAAGRVCERILPLLEPGKSVRFAFMPDGEDPDSLIKSSGVQGFKDVIKCAVSLFDFLWNSYTQGKSYDTPDEKASIKKQLENEIARIAHRDVQEMYRGALRDRISTVFYPPRQKQKFSKGQSYVAADVSMLPKKPRCGHEDKGALRELFFGLINYPFIFESVEEVLSTVAFKAPRLEQLRQDVCSYLSGAPDAGHDDLVHYLEDLGYAQEISDICNESVYVHASFCSPSANEENILSKWLEYWNDYNAAGLEEEIHDGWKRAYLDSSQQEEEKLRSLLSARTGEEGT
ncbi:MAG: DNA primase [Alphaproteobacteria bacterium]|nr:DNA primase [Alphaproteobacteria bacterium]